MDAKTKRLDYYKQHLGKEIEQASDEEKLNQLLEIMKQVIDGDRFIFEIAYPDYTQEVNMKLTEEFGRDYKYKGGDVTFNIQNIVRDYGREAIEEFEKTRDKMKEQTDKLLNQHENRLLDNFITHKTSLFNLKRDMKKRAQAGSDKLRYVGLANWKDDIRKCYNDYSEQQDDKYEEMLTANEIITSKNREFYRNQLNEYKAKIQNYCKEKTITMTEAMKGSTLNRQEIKKEIHRMEDGVRDKINAITDSYISKLSRHHESLTTEFEKAEDDLRFCGHMN